MRLVIDTNRIMAGLLKDSTSRRIILHRSFEFFSPDYIGIELFKHRPYLIKKRQRLRNTTSICSCTPCLRTSSLFRSMTYEPEYQHAIEIMKPVDENDAPFLAVGIALGIDHIWTEDRHFQKQDILRVCTTRDLIGMI